jgi:hypothetical protein
MVKGCRKSNSVIPLYAEGLEELFVSLKARVKFYSLLRTPALSYMYDNLRYVFTLIKYFKVYYDDIVFVASSCS